MTNIWIDAFIVWFHMCCFWHWKFHMFLFFSRIYVWCKLFFKFSDFNCFFFYVVGVWFNVFFSTCMYILYFMCCYFWHMCVWFCALFFHSCVWFTRCFISQDQEMLLMFCFLHIIMHRILSRVMTLMRKERSQGMN